MTIKVNYKRKVLDDGDFVKSAILTFSNQPQFDETEVTFFVNDTEIEKESVRFIDNRVIVDFKVSSELAVLHFDINRFVNEIELPQLRLKINNEKYISEALEIQYDEDSYIEKFKMEYYQGGTTTLSYYLYSSNKKKDKRPLVVFLHGSGERGFGEGRPLLGNDVPKTIFEYVKEHEDAVILVPQATWATDLNGWFRKDVRYCLMEMINHIVEKENIDNKRIYLTGLSNGGAGTWHFAQHYPERFAAIIPCCGYIYNDEKFFLSAEGRGRYMQPTAAELQSLKNMPVWAFHAADDKTVSVNGTIESISALQELGNQNAKATIYPPGEVTPDPHGSWKLAFNDPKILEWLFAQSL